ncbi:MAG TPA: UDP-N-acetylmuramoyl-L-alanine--D-glutamate ligase [Rhodocyclaceae bacterium]|nr:UDP-N-acetylmuramoyl-L-alanine--D-glutamate ligase [Rhodocyclaceae bacterium]
MELRGKHVLVLGLGESGLAMARWCARSGARVRVADSRAEPPNKGALLAQVPTAELACSYFDDRFDKSLLKGIDLLALSPGLSGGLMPVLHARAQGIAVVGEIELFAWALDSLGVRDTTRVLAITGTNGKTTTTALTAHLCNSVGRRAIAAGNISPSALDALMDAQDADDLPQVWVLELSSFQLETLDSLNADAATVLNVSDDHLDRYQGLDDYAGAKARVFFGFGAQVLNRQDARVRKMAIDGRRLVSFGLDAPGHTQDFGLKPNKGEPWIVQGDSFLLPISELPIAGLHNAANAMAALALCQAIDINPVSALPGLRSFKGLAHRVEKVDEINGVTYYDDSKGTNVGATLAALQGMGRKVVLILGGDGKGQDFSPLTPAVTEHARAVVLIGRDGPKIGEVLIDSGVPLQGAADMDEAVRLAAAAALAGDAVLLSPACASLDMYRNYAHRAEVFIDAVRRLKGAQA